MTQTRERQAPPVLAPRSKDVLVLAQGDPIAAQPSPILCRMGNAARFAVPGTAQRMRGAPNGQPLWGSCGGMRSLRFHQYCRSEVPVQLDMGLGDAAITGPAPRATTLRTAEADRQARTRCFFTVAPT